MIQKLRSLWSTLTSKLPVPPTEKTQKPKADPVVKRREITHLVVHCTASPQTSTVASIVRYWKEVRGWAQVGYHLIVPANGASVRLANDNEVTNGVGGHNAHSLHVSYIGGIDLSGRALDNRTQAQKAELLRILKRWRQTYPNAKIVGHRDFLTKGKPGWKECPSFPASEEYKNI